MLALKLYSSGCTRNSNFASDSTPLHHPPRRSIIFQLYSIEQAVNIQCNDLDMRIAPDSRRDIMLRTFSLRMTVNHTRTYLG